MGVTKWEGVIVGYFVDSVGYRVWDPKRGKIFTVAVPSVDEDVEPGWWKEGTDGEDSGDFEEIVFPDQAVDRVEGVAARIQTQRGVGEDELPPLVEDSSDDDDDDDIGGEDDDD